MSEDDRGPDPSGWEAVARYAVPGALIDAEENLSNELHRVKDRLRAGEPVTKRDVERVRIQLNELEETVGNTLDPIATGDDHTGLFDEETEDDDA